VDLWELVARESIRDRIARWNAHGDAGRFADMVLVLAPDVEFQAGASSVLHGRDTVLAYLGGAFDDAEEPAAGNPLIRAGSYTPAGGRPSIRHFTSTTMIDFRSQARARVRTYYAVLSSFGLDHWGRYLDEFELVDGTWLIAKRTVTTEGVDPDGWAAALGG
jgi:hypothetical protein